MLQRRTPVAGVPRKVVELIQSLERAGYVFKKQSYTRRNFRGSSGYTSRSPSEIVLHQTLTQFMSNADTLRTLCGNFTRRMARTFNEGYCVFID